MLSQTDYLGENKSYKQGDVRIGGYLRKFLRI